MKFDRWPIYITKNQFFQPNSEFEFKIQIWIWTNLLTLFFKENRGGVPNSASFSHFRKKQLYRQANIRKKKESYNLQLGGRKWRRKWNLHNLLTLDNKAQLIRNFDPNLNSKFTWKQLNLKFKLLRPFCHQAYACTQVLQGNVTQGVTWGVLFIA